MLASIPPTPTSIEGGRSGPCAPVEVVAESQDRDAEDRVEGAHTAFRKLDRSGHHAEPEAADGGGHHEAVLDDAAAERDDPEGDREQKADFVDRRVEED